MVRIKLTQRKLMDIYDRLNKKPKILLSENKLSAIYDRLNEPAVKFKRKNRLYFQDIANTTIEKNCKYNK